MIPLIFPDLEERMNKLFQKNLSPPTKSFSQKFPALEEKVEQLLEPVQLKLPTTHKRAFTEAERKLGQHWSIFKKNLAIEVPPPLIKTPFNFKIIERKEWEKKFESILKSTQIEIPNTFNFSLELEETEARFHDFLWFLDFGLPVPPANLRALRKKEEEKARKRAISLNFFLTKRFEKKLGNLFLEGPIKFSKPFEFRLSRYTKWLQKKFEQLINPPEEIGIFRVISHASEVQKVSFSKLPLWEQELLKKFWGIFDNQEKSLKEASQPQVKIFSQLEEKFSSLFGRKRLNNIEENLTAILDISNFWEEAIPPKVPAVLPTADKDLAKLILFGEKRRELRTRLQRPWPTHHGRIKTFKLAFPPATEEEAKRRKILPQLKVGPGWMHTKKWVCHFHIEEVVEITTYKGKRQAYIKQIKIPEYWQVHQRIPVQAVPGWLEKIENFEARAGREVDNQNKRPKWLSLEEWKFRQENSAEFLQLLELEALENSSAKGNPDLWRKFNSK